MRSSTASVEPPPTDPGGTAPPARFVPIPLAEVDGGELAGDVRPNANGEVLLRVFEDGWPVTQRVESGLTDAAAISARAREIAAVEGSGRPAGWAPAGSPSGELVSVVICTLGSDLRLRAAVDAVLAQTHAALDLIIVDNDPRSGGVTAHLRGLDDPRLRVVQEPRRGLSVARNSGLARARGSIVAFTDDDALPHPGWVEMLVRAFASDPDHRIACVTGLVLAEGFATEAQRFFEECASFAKGFRAMHWSQREPDGALAELTEPGFRGVAFPYSGGEFGSGNNMAFRTAALRALGGFDVALGTGSPTRGGEDLDIFRRVYLSGMDLVYLPAAVVGHHHRPDMAGLTRQMYGHGTGMAAHVTKLVLAGQIWPILRRLPASLSHLLRPGSLKNERKSASFPPEVTRAELKGYLHGPFLYVESRLAARRKRLAGGPR